jgi:hypothetical protein
MSQRRPYVSVSAGVADHASCAYAEKFVVRGNLLLVEKPITWTLDAVPPRRAATPLKLYAWTYWSGP